MKEVFFNLQDGTLYIPDIPEQERAPLPTEVPLRTLLLSDDIQICYDNLPKKPTRSIPNEEYVRTGKAILQALAEEPEKSPFTKEVFRKASSLRLLPSERTIFRKFGGYEAFLEQIDAEDNSMKEKFASMSSFETCEYIAEIMNDFYPNKKMTNSMLHVFFELGICPERTTLFYSGVTVSDINRHLGFPDIPSWTEQDYIEYGAAVLEHNGLSGLKTTSLRALSRKNLGPDPAVITRKFHSLHTFRELAVKRLEENKLRKERIDIVLSSAPRKISESSTEHKQQVYAVHSLLMHFFKDAPEASLLKIACGGIDVAFSHIIKNFPNHTQPDVELTALELGLLDDIYPSRLKMRAPKL